MRCHSHLEPRNGDGRPITRKCDMKCRQRKSQPNLRNYVRQSRKPTNAIPCGAPRNSTMQWNAVQIIENNVD
eukprot:5126755-Pyramimonas_sp.AAC.2